MPADSALPPAPRASTPSTRQAAPRARPIRGLPRASRELGDRPLLWRICIPATVWEPGDEAGRWHHAGEPMVYASLSPPLAALEALAQRDNGREARQRHRLACIGLPPGPRLVLRAADLPANWLDDEARTRDFGSGWIAGRTSALLFVPSVLVPHAYNALINTAHPDWQPQTLKAREWPFCFDRRLC
jgi:RES domain-containing protein